MLIESELSTKFRRIKMELTRLQLIFISFSFVFVLYVCTLHCLTNGSQRTHWLTIWSLKVWKIRNLPKNLLLNSFRSTPTFIWFIRFVQPLPLPYLNQKRRILQHLNKKNNNKNHPIIQCRTAEKKKNDFLKQ